MFGCFKAMSVNEQPMLKLRDFIAGMQGRGGSLFKEGLVIPEGTGYIDLGDDDEEELEVIV